MISADCGDPVFGGGRTACDCPHLRSGTAGAAVWFFPPFPPEAPRAGRRSLRRLFGAPRSSGRTGPEKISRKWFPVPPEKQPEGGK
ncbi:MAG: hypothetical protein BAA03_14360 [Caldibacillus debilis]|nr:MAG: hypothetical protein BAA03_14360 [Caldibacillus debilis]